MSKLLYQRVLLKFSGEALAGKSGFGIDPSKALQLSKEIKSVHDLGVGIILIVGAGNIFRGVQAANKGMDRVTGDYLGMLATIMNAISLQDALEHTGVETRTLSAITVTQISEPYIRRRALRHLEKGRIVIVAGGTGNPYFTTDTAAVLRATELRAEVVVKATKVDGIFDKDPVSHPDAVRFDTVTFEEVLNKNLRVMDLTAITLCKENNLPIRVLNMNESGSMVRMLQGEDIGTLVTE
ncbi:MAG: UMP kinase [Fidelibacterota bacterium]